MEIAGKCLIGKGVSSAMVLSLADSDCGLSSRELFFNPGHWLARENIDLGSFVQAAM